MTETKNTNTPDQGQGVPSDARQFSPWSERNKGPLLEALSTVLPISAQVLEIASGSGEHAVHMCTAMPGLKWHPTDISDDALASIEAWRQATGLENLASPSKVDVTEEDWWAQIGCSPSIIFSANMIHIAPWEAALGLIKGVGAVLPDNGMLIFYGPFARGGIHSAASNEEFDASLKSRNPAWGVRDLDDLSAAAKKQGMSLEQEISMPSNNHVLVFRKSSS